MLKYTIKTARGVKTIRLDIDLTAPDTIIELDGANFHFEQDWTFSNQYGERKMPQHIKHVRHELKAQRGTVIRRAVDHKRGTVDISDMGIIVNGVPCDGMEFAVIATLEAWQWHCVDSIPASKVLQVLEGKA